jgi:hypothetical protein
MTCFLEWSIDLTIAMPAILHEPDLTVLRAVLVVNQTGS